MLAVYGVPFVSKLLVFNCEVDTSRDIINIARDMYINSARDIGGIYYIPRSIYISFTSQLNTPFFNNFETKGTP